MTRYRLNGKYVWYDTLYLKINKGEAYSTFPLLQMFTSSKSRDRIRLPDDPNPLDIRQRATKTVDETRANGKDDAHDGGDGDQSGDRDGDDDRDDDDRDVRGANRKDNRHNRYPNPHIAVSSRKIHHMDKNSP